MLPILAGLLLKSEWKPPWSHNCYTLYGSNRSTTLMPRSTACLSSSYAPFYHGWRVLQMPGWLNAVNKILENKFPRPIPFFSMFLGLSSCSKIFHFEILSLGKFAPCWLFMCSQDMFPIVLIQSTWLFKNANLVSKQAVLHSIFVDAFFFIKLKKILNGFSV